jgi:N-acetylglucosaminyl-diphospho-decaprenol L-rhamnosyltransferase
MTSISAIIVNFESGNRLRSLVDTLLADGIPLVIVDNASTDQSLAMLPRSPSQPMRVIRNEKNLGFAVAANQGAAEAEGEWLIFVNPDVHPEPGLAPNIIRNLHDSVAIAAPLQVDATRTPIPESGGYRPSLARFAAWAVLPTGLRGRNGPWLAPPFPHGDVSVAWVSGAMLAVRREVFSEIGGFDERFFLFQEDVNLCERAWVAGHRVMLRGGIRVFHEVGQSGDGARDTIRGRAFVAALGTQWKGWRRRILGAILLLGFGLRAGFGSDRRNVARAALRPSAGLLFGRGKAP